MTVAASHLYTLNDLVRQHERRDLQKIAVVDGEQRLSYGVLLQNVRRFASFLQDSGLDRGDRVGLFLRRSVDYVVAFFAIQLVGGIAVPINDRLRARQVDYILKHVDARVIIAAQDVLQRTEGLDLSGRVLINTDDTRELPDGTIDDVSVLGKDLATIMYTSGSTGMPKGIMLSHENILAGAQSVSDYLELSERDIVISLLPFSFDYGLNQLMSMLFVGGTLVIQRSMFPADICRTVQFEGVTGMAGVPLLWTQLAERYSPFLKTSFPNLRYLTNSGGPFPAPLVPILRRAHPKTRLYLMYGLTEAFRSTFLPPDQVDVRPESIGKAIPNAEILVLNENGKPCGPDEPGELIHRGVHVAQGYWRDQEATAKVFKPHPLLDPQHGRTETVVYSGDLVRMDAEGYLYFVGRKDQLIKSHSIRVSPEEVEHYLYASNLVSAAAVFAVAAPGGGTNIIAAIVPKDGTMKSELLRAFCKREMPEYMQPAEFLWQDALPQTSSGKPDRQSLKDVYVSS
jgi:acyl-CoA ligase (AMP-forming) (exosortase A-associated)